MIDIKKCVGCRRCEMSCPINGIIFLDYPIKCFHCEKAPCLEVCPENAIERINNKVVIIKDKCIGCGLCALACPFGAIRMGKVAMKCNGCYKLEKEICKTVCPTGAINDLENIINEKLKMSNERYRIIHLYSR
ncbi:carbon monoxide dehydrogenase iron sulfur subunit CooF1 [Methanocaldococcus villosus KIN24-T80]|uniref:Carbon monoxide dehydrogenase iron sulfur subunit CooF1 n=1 Tax=Methanocaldococcus villosus KIN24-T80 TaxID=1069083 RepID=N6UVZ7_9EURY|nr:4Fe-4S binding protein [Methanocaldococcus villosus]ENN96499.1 carbon monoxide dehydrogenase iron sulfur subunit CooF1 [Methanocaldococcus villosus KIN24-T80]